MKDKTLRGSAFAAPFEKLHKYLSVQISDAVHTSATGFIRNAAYLDIKYPVTYASPYRCVGWCMCDARLFTGRTLRM